MYNTAYLSWKHHGGKNTGENGLQVFIKSTVGNAVVSIIKLNHLSVFTVFELLLLLHVDHNVEGNDQRPGNGHNMNIILT